jgi:long-chain fatty acid transport protein
MRHPLRVISLGLLAALAGAALASASGFELFQHGGRAMSQAGAMTARASEPSAVYYNPAAITRLEGFQLQAGLDFSNAEDKYSSPTGSFAARHVIQFPPSLYATWRSKGTPFALGIGIDSPAYYTQNWDPALFPGRFLTRRVELRLFEVHPVLAYDLGDGWSVGGGFRYLSGNLDQEDNGLFVFSGNPSPGSPVNPITVEEERNASADVDAYAWDLAIHYAAPSWGWGGVFRSAAELRGNGDVSYRGRDIPSGVPGLDAFLQGRFGAGSVRESFEIPRELRGGIWYAPYPELRLELDASYQSWSSLGSTDVTYTPNAFGDGPTVRTARDWKDTTSLRLGIEGDITDNFMLHGGVSSEPSPVNGRTLEPGFPWADATVYGAGFTYSFPRLSFDVAYSFFQYDSRRAAGQELQNPARTGTFSSREQRWAASARWRF